MYPGRPGSLVLLFPPQILSGPSSLYKAGGPALFSGLQVVARVRSSLGACRGEDEKSYSSLIRSFLLWCWKGAKGPDPCWGPHSPWPEGLVEGATKRSPPGKLQHRAMLLSSFGRWGFLSTVHPVSSVTASQCQGVAQVSTGKSGGPPGGGRRVGRTAEL